MQLPLARANTNYATGSIRSLLSLSLVCASMQHATCLVVPYPPAALSAVRMMCAAVEAQRLRAATCTLPRPVRQADAKNVTSCCLVYAAVICAATHSETHLAMMRFALLRALDAVVLAAAHVVVVRSSACDIARMQCR